MTRSKKLKMICEVSDVVFQKDHYTKLLDNIQKLPIELRMMIWKERVDKAWKDHFQRMRLKMERQIIGTIPYESCKGETIAFKCYRERMKEIWKNNDPSWSPSSRNNWRLMDIEDLIDFSILFIDSDYHYVSSHLSELGNAH